MELRPHLTTPRTRTLCLLAGLLLVGTAARAQDGAAGLDGTVVARDTLRFTADERARLLPFVEARVGSPEGAAAAFDGVVVERITYLSDGLRVTGYLAAPREGTALPAVVYNRGGTEAFGAIDTVTVAAIFVPLAARGYVVVGGQYRGNDGGEGREAFGGADIDDVLSLIPLLDRHPRVDADRLGMYGWSRGGLMTYLALARTDRVRAAVVGSGMSDAFVLVADRPEMETEVLARLVPNWASERETALDARSPVRWADRLHKGAPLLLLHGSADRRVGPDTALDMARALYEARHPVRFVFYEGGDHGLSEYRAEVFAEVAAWFDRYVRDGSPLPDLEPHGR